MRKLHLCAQELISLILSYTHVPSSVHRDKTAIDGQVCLYEWSIADPVKCVEANLRL